MLKTKYGIFTDRIDLDGKVIQTAEEVYQEWLKNKDKPQTPEPTTEEKLEEITSRMQQMDETIAEIMLNM